MILYSTIAKLPQLSAEDQINSTQHFYRELNRFGLTSAVDTGGGGHVYPTDYQASKTLASQGKLPIRISNYLFAQKVGNGAAGLREVDCRGEAEPRQARHSAAG